jgi:dihydrofolate reductase
VRRIVAGLFISLDGVVEAPEKWHLRYFTDEMGQIIDATAEHSDAVLLGRRTYEEFASFWPLQGSELPLADYFNSVQKHVVSTTLDALGWANSSLITGDVAQQIGMLKGRRGRNIQVMGSATLVRFLLREGLLDELALLVHPIVVGGGKRLFEDLTFGAALALAESRALGSGVVALSYVPAGNGARRRTSLRPAALPSTT